MIVAALVLLASHGELHRMDADIPEQPALPRNFDAATPRHEAGTNHTLFINFEGITLTECNPSDSHRGCSWYNFGQEFEPFSGDASTRVSILQAMRQDAAGFGLRITGQRPPDGENYTMMIYGGLEAEFGALGSAPAGDCGNMRPNQVGFAHVDGELADWINGGANTALHEAAHTWGLDHIDVDGTVMFPSGDNSPSFFNDGCAQIVQDTELNPGEGSCPDLNRTYCGDPNLQNEFSLLTELFGEPYIDTTPPTIELLEPMDGQYFQAPAEFDVVLNVVDDLHPQRYQQWAWIEGMTERPAEPSLLAAPGFKVEELPIGSYTFNVVVADEEGHEASVAFEIEVGEDPPPDPVMEESGCACHAGVRPGFFAGWLLVPLLALRRRGG